MSPPLRVMAMNAESIRTEKLPDVAGIQFLAAAARPAEMTAATALSLASFVLNRAKVTPYRPMLMI